MLGLTGPCKTDAALEKKPLLQKASEPQLPIGSLWTGLAVMTLVSVWCVLDSWNREVAGRLSDELQPTKYALTLVFMQFFSMAFLFLSAFAMASWLTGGLGFSKAVSQLRNIRWPSLVISHILSSFLLQGVMMPKQMMSLGLFAASRAVEVPTAAALRSKVFGTRCGGHTVSTTVFVFGSAWLIFYSYTQIADCLCIWSGYGVMLTGPALYAVYALMLTVPAANVVFQEAIMVQLETHPLLMLGLQNLFAAIVFMPVLIGAHVLGYENIFEAYAVLVGSSRPVMVVVWLCLQTAGSSFVTVGLINMLDSFWTVATRSMRVIFWWIRELVQFYLVSSTLLSVARPHASVWSFVMLCGLLLMVGGILVDKRDPLEKKSTGAPSFGKFV